MLVLVIEDIRQPLSQARQVLLRKETLSSVDEVKLEHRIAREHILQIIVTFFLQEHMQFARKDLLALCIEEETVLLAEANELFQCLRLPLKDLRVRVSSHELSDSRHVDQDLLLSDAGKLLEVSLDERHLGKE